MVLVCEVVVLVCDVCLYDLVLIGLVYFFKILSGKI